MDKKHPHNFQHLKSNIFLKRSVPGVDFILKTLQKHICKNKRMKLFEHMPDHYMSHDM